MDKMRYYILAWHDEGANNRAEKIWEGGDPKEARQRFNEAKFTDDIFFFEVWANHPDYDEDTKVEYKYI